MTSEKNPFSHIMYHIQRPALEIIQELASLGAILEFCLTHLFKDPVL